MVNRKTVLVYVLLFTVGCVMASLWAGQPVFRGGDWGYYVDVADRTRPPHDARFGGTPDHPIVPYLLIFFNLIVRNASATVFGFTVVGYALTYILIYQLAGQTSGNKWISLITFLFALGTTPAMVSPTALKNLWGIVFFLFSLIFIHRIAVDGYTRNNLLTLTVFSLLTLFSHSLPIFLLIPSLLTLSFNHWNPQVLLLTILSIPFTVTVLTVVNRLRKLSVAFTSFMENPSGIILYNLTRLSGTMVALPFFLIFLLSTILEGLFELIYGGVKPIFWGLAIGVSIMYFTGCYPFGGRFYVNATPSVLLMFTHLLTLFPRLKEVKTEL